MESGTTFSVGDLPLSLADRDWKNLINGELRSSRDFADVVFPGTGQVFTQIPVGTTEDVDHAVASAKAAFEKWSRISIHERARFLNKLADAIEENGDDLAILDTFDNGSPMNVMRNDFRLAVEHIRYFAGLALELKGDTVPVSEWNALNFSLTQPFGVVGRIVPFNHPFLFAASRIAAPLLAGNTVVLKPAQVTSLSALRLGEIAREILPPGVLNVISGSGSVVGERIVRHPDVPRIAFTGSEEVGKGIQLGAAESGAVKTVTLELGGKNPIIVFDDADISQAVDGVLRGMNFTWQGQSCGSTSRLYVAEGIYQDFVSALSQKMDAMVLGDPRESSTDVGPVVSASQYQKVSSYIEHGMHSPDLELRAGGMPDPNQTGYYIRPTLFSSATSESSNRLFHEEIFGPVLVAAPFRSEEQVIGLANALNVGLTASVWTQDLGTAMRSVRDLHSGYVWVNWSSTHIPGTGFGGVKNSGLGREENIHELTSFTQAKNVYVRF